jgi:type III secretion protein U
VSDAGATEQPTPRRLAEAQRRGEVAVSRDLTGAVALSAGLAALAAEAPSLGGALARQLRSGLAAALTARTPPGPALLEAAGVLARLLGLPLGAALLGALLAGGLQAGGLLALHPVRPQPERLSPGRGLSRLASLDRLALLALGAVKAAVVVVLTWGWARAAAPSLATLPRAGSPALAAAALAGSLLPRLGGAILAFALADLLWTRRRHLRTLRMTRDQVRRERRDEEGDPHHQAERKRQHRALLEAPPVARATCVVVNPTHVAVALLHRRDLDEAPRVVAKGLGAAARRIRSEARRAGVPIVRDVALARALHRLAEVGDEIPEELFDAAAAVLVHLHRAVDLAGSP